MTDPFTERESDRVLANESYQWLGGCIMCDTARHLYDKRTEYVEWEREGELLCAKCPFCGEWTILHDTQGMRMCCVDYAKHDDDECVFRN